MEAALGNIDLSELLPEELFDEIDKPNAELHRVSTALYESNCSELLGNCRMELYVDDADNFYVLRSDKEPIGDYGSHWVDCWYKCNDNGAVQSIIDGKAVR